MSPRRRGGGLGRAASRTPAQRVGNTTFYVVAEGEGTEYDYLSRLNTTYGSTHRFLIRMPPPSVRRNGLTPSAVVEHATSVSKPGDVDQVWALFDHDGRTNIDRVCRQGQPDRVNLALSHPAFELWLLLHFQDFAPVRQNGRNQLIIDKLRAAHPAFTDYGRREKRISDQRFSALVENDGIGNAVRRARALSRDLSGQAPSNRDPSTDVHLLMEALGIK